MCLYLIYRHSYPVQLEFIIAIKYLIKLLGGGENIEIKGLKCIETSFWQN